MGEKKAKEGKKEEGGDTKSEGEADTWSKTFGDSISSFFGDKDKDGQETNEKEDSKKDKKKESGDKKKEKEDKKKKEKEEKKKKEAEKKKEKPKEPKVNQIKAALQFETNMVDSFGLNKEQYNSSKEKLNKLGEIDRIKQERETSLNDLESFILNIREKLYEDIYEKFYGRGKRKN